MTEERASYDALHGKYVWSRDRHQWQAPGFDTRDAALKAANHELGPAATAYTGRLVRRRLTDYTDVGKLLEWIRQQGEEDVGELVYMGPFPPKNFDDSPDSPAQKELDAFLEHWAERHGLHPWWYAVVDVRVCGDVQV